MASMIHVVVVLLKIQILFASEEGIPSCLKFEHVPCGDPSGAYQWEFCTISSPDQRITKVDLDKRFKNGYCSKYNFGITTNNERFWVHQWCYGTFRVCYISEDDFQPESKTPADIDNNSINKKKARTVDLYKSNTKAVASTSHTLAPDKDSNDTEHHFTQPDEETTHSSTTSESGIDVVKAVTTGYNEQSTILTNSESTAGNVSTARDVNMSMKDLSPKQRTDIKIMPRITERVWIVAVLGVAGGVLLVLIAVIFFITFKRCNRVNTDIERRSSGESSTADLVDHDTETNQDKPYTETYPENPYSATYRENPYTATYRDKPYTENNPEKTYTETYREKSVYDFIPIDPDTGLPAILDDDEASCSHYSEVKPKVIKIHEDSTKLNIYDRTSIDQDYDVLNKPRSYRSMSESSHYSHLGDLSCSLMSRDNTQTGDVTNHVYAILMPIDSGHFNFVEEETGCLPSQGFT